MGAARSAAAAVSPRLHRRRREPRVIITTEFVPSRRTTRPERGALAPQHLAYVLFTSGSTGRPKGGDDRSRRHRQRAHLRAAAAGARQTDAFLQLAPYTFDLAVHEMFWPLTTGARLVLVPEGDHRDPRRIVEEIRARDVTTLHPVPTVLRALLAQTEPALEECTHLRTMFSGGEALPPDVLREFMRRLAERAAHQHVRPDRDLRHGQPWLHRADAAGVAIGKPCSKTQFYVLDETSSRCRSASRASCSSAAPARARLPGNRPSSPRALRPRSVRHAPGGRMYRTGDLARRWRRRQHRVPRPRRRPGQAPRLPHRARRDRGRAARASGRAEVAVVVDGSGPATRAWSRTSSAASAWTDRRRCARSSVAACPSTWCRACSSRSTHCRSRRAARSIATRCPHPRSIARAPRTAAHRRRARPRRDLARAPRSRGRRRRRLLRARRPLAARRAARRADPHASRRRATPRSRLRAPDARALAARSPSSDAPRRPRYRSSAPTAVSVRCSRAQQRLWFLHQLEPDGNAYVFAFSRDSAARSTSKPCGAHSRRSSSGTKRCAPCSRPSMANRIARIAATRVDAGRRDRDRRRRCDRGGAPAPAESRGGADSSLASRALRRRRPRARARPAPHRVRRLVNRSAVARARRAVLRVRRGHRRGSPRCLSATSTTRRGSSRRSKDLRSATTSRSGSSSSPAHRKTRRYRRGPCPPRQTFNGETLALRLDAELSAKLARSPATRTRRCT